MIKIPGPIPIFISPFFWVMALAIGWFSTQSVSETPLWVVIILISVLFHEFGHALTAAAFGQKVLVELTGYGGLTIRPNGKSLKPWKEFLIGLNGPLAGFLLCAIAYYLLLALPKSLEQSVPAYMLTVGVYINLFWTIINLLPIQPLDGGKLLRVALEAFFGVKGTKIAFFLSIIVASVMGIFFFTRQSYLAGSIFFLLAYEGYRDWSASLSMSDDDSDEGLKEELRNAQYDLENENHELALQKFLKIREKVKSGVIFDVATQSAGSILAADGEKEKAYELLNPMRKQLSPRGLQLLQHLAFALGYFDEVTKLGSEAFQAFPDYDTALINACAHAKLGQVKPAVGWIQCAIKEGLPSPNIALQKSEFDTIRRDPLFQELKEKYASHGS
jgi:Zn-dependent protease